MVLVVYSQMFHVGQLVSKIPDVLFFRIFISVLGLVMVLVYSQMFYVVVSKIPDVLIFRIFIGVLDLVEKRRL
jgi:hypothetical protein